MAGCGGFFLLAFTMSVVLSWLGRRSMRTTTIRAVTVDASPNPSENPAEVNREP